MNIVAGIDIGGSHITVGIVDLKNGVVINSSVRREQVNSQQNADGIINSWTSVILDSFKSQDCISPKIAISMPGPFDYSAGISLIKNQNKYDSLYGLNVKELLSKSLSIKQENIILVNDTLCFLKGEIFGGIAKGFNNVIGLTLGTGLGSSTYVNGELEDANLWCSVFKNGIAEDYLSTRWFLKRYNELLKKNVTGVKQLVRLVSEDTDSKKVFQEFGKNLGDFLIPFINKQQPELIVLGGNISHALPYFISELDSTLHKKNMRIEIKKAQLGENAALLGAASFSQAPLKLSYT